MSMYIIFMIERWKWFLEQTKQPSGVEVEYTWSMVVKMFMWFATKMTSYFWNVFSKSINHHIQIPSLTDIDG